MESDCDNLPYVIMKQPKIIFNSTEIGIWDFDALHIKPIYATPVHTFFYGDITIVWQGESVALHLAVLFSKLWAITR